MSREQDVIHLFKNIDITDPEVLQVLLARNFSEIENRMGIIQTCLKDISGGSVVDVTAKIKESFSDVSAALIAAAAAQETADGQIQGFFQPDMPGIGMSFGDIWIDTDGHTPPTEEDIYRYMDEDFGSQGALAWRPASTNAVGLVYLSAYIANSSAYDAQGTATQALAAAEGSSQELTDFVNKTYIPDQQSAQAQIDGKIETWFYESVPTMGNYPANRWTTEEDKEKHVGDLFYNTVTGYGYEFNKSTTPPGTSLTNISGGEYVEYDGVKYLALAYIGYTRRVLEISLSPAAKWENNFDWPSQDEVYDELWSMSLRAAPAPYWTRTANDANTAWSVTETGMFEAIDKTNSIATRMAKTLPEYLGVMSGTGTENDPYVVRGSFYWDPVSDSGIQQALSDAASAQDTADKKRRVFVAEPTAPYDIGDLWTGGPAGEIMRCKTAKAIGGEYSAGDWEPAAKYTDDTVAKAKIRTFYQAAIPVAESQGDLWVDIDDNNKMYRAAAAGADIIGAGEWEPVRDLGVTRSAATYVITDGSTSNNVKNADYVVPVGSTSAQTVINEAINALPADGGKVLLLEGTYVVDGPIVVHDNVALEGQGKNTVIKLKDGVPSAVNIIANSDTVNGNANLSILSLTIDANNSNNATTNNNGIYFEKVTESTMFSVTIRNAYNGIYLVLSDENSVLNALITGCKFAGTYLGGCCHNSLTGNFVQYNNCNGLSIYSHGISPKILSIGNIVNGNNISNNGITMLGATGMVLRGQETTVMGNVVQGNSSAGIDLSGEKNTVSNNICKLNGDEGIYFGGSDNIVSNNICSENSQKEHNVYSNITLDAGGSYNSVQNNNCRRGILAKQPKYGIAIIDTNCIGTMVTNNDLYQSGATGSYSDGGTSTKTSATNRI